MCCDITCFENRTFSAVSEGERVSRCSAHLTARERPMRLHVKLAIRAPRRTFLTNSACGRPSGTSCGSRLNDTEADRQVIMGRAKFCPPHPRPLSRGERGERRYAGRARRSGVAAVAASLLLLAGAVPAFAQRDPAASPAPAVFLDADSAAAKMLGAARDFLAGPRRRGRSIAAAGCERRANEALARKTWRPDRKERSDLVDSRLQPVNVGASRRVSP